MQKMNFFKIICFNQTQVVLTIFVLKIRNLSKKITLILSKKENKKSKKKNPKIKLN